MVFSQKSLDFEKNIFRRARRRHYWLRWSQRWRPQQRAQVEIFLFLISSKKRFLFQVKKVISQNVSYFQWNVECKRWRCGHHHLAPSQHCRPPPLGNIFWNPKSTINPPSKVDQPLAKPWWCPKLLKQRLTTSRPGPEIQTPWELHPALFYLPGSQRSLPYIGQSLVRPISFQSKRTGIVLFLDICRQRLWHQL